MSAAPPFSAPGADALDASVILRARDGDRQAFRQIVAARQGRVFRMLARLSGGVNVEAAARDVFLRLHSGLPRLRTPDSLDCLLCRLVIEVAKLYHGRPGCHAGVSVELAAALNAIPARDRALLILREVEGLMPEELARACGVSAAAMAQRLSRARRSVVTALGQ
jgi:RNA polymerase sigma-70 factor, ECF subfamily